MSTLDEVLSVPPQAAHAPSVVWTAVCALDDLVPERGAAALVDGEQVALFRLLDGSVHAIGNLDPFSGAQVLARGIVGSRDGAPMVASPLYKQHFDLATGRCLEQPGTRVPVHAVRVVDGTVLLSLAPGAVDGAEDLVPAPVTDQVSDVVPDLVPRDG